MSEAAPPNLCPQLPAISAPMTYARESCAGHSTRFPIRVRQDMRPGPKTPGRLPVPPTTGSEWRWTLSGDWCSCRPVLRRTTSTEPTGLGTISLLTRCWRWMRTPGSEYGIFRQSSTTSGTATSRHRPALFASDGAASGSMPWLRQRKRVMFTCSSAPPVNLCFLLCIESTRQATCPVK